jgi:hypothetical protein
MNSACGGRGWGGVSVELVIRKTEHGWKWVVEDGFSVSEFQSISDEGDHDREEAKEAKNRDLVPWLFAAVDRQEKWWERLRGNPKRAGEISQAAFLLKAEMMGFHVALPWGDSERYDFVVWSQDARRVFRVQVKGTGRLYRRGYEVQPVHSTRKGGKKRYTKKDIDVIAAHVQPADAWYLIPIERVGRAKSLRLYPGIESRQTVGRKKRARRAPREWEQWRNAWEVLGQGG